MMRCADVIQGAAVGNGTRVYRPGKVVGMQYVSQKQVKIVKFSVVGFAGDT